MNDSLKNFLKIAFIGASFLGVYHHFHHDNLRPNPLLSSSELGESQRQRNLFGGVLGAVRKKRQYVKRKQAAYNLLQGIQGAKDFEKIKRKRYSKTDVKNLGPIRKAPILIGDKVFYQTFRV
jgi:hypothetical protein